MAGTGATAGTNGTAVSDPNAERVGLRIGACPRCSVELETLTHAGIKAAACPKCEGVWLGPSELVGAIRFFAANQGTAPKTIALLEGPSRRTTLFCPECTSSLRSVTLRGVDVEKCPSCGGVFLDRGESETIAKRVMFSAATWEPAHQELLRTLRLIRERLAQEMAEKRRREDGPNQF